MSKIPEFKTKEEEADFWETHDTTEFLDELIEVDCYFPPKKTRPLIGHLVRKGKAKPIPASLACQRGGEKNELRPQSGI